ncbi:MAG TPA: hypothetical protein PKW80_04665 [Bacteroidales bacterium]|nr:hypothetical protein [Bacteroidales bacterium]
MIYLSSACGGAGEGIVCNEPMMANVKIFMQKVLFVLLFIPMISFGQKTDAVKKFLEGLYLGFPLEANDSVINDYLKNNPEFISKKNIYDSSRIDYYKTINLDEYLNYKPLSSNMQYYYSPGWTFKNVTVEHSQTIVVSIFYGDSLQFECSSQYEHFVKNLKSITSKSQNYKIYTDPGEVGYGCGFFRKRTDKVPFLTIDLHDFSCTDLNCTIFIAYHKILNE